MSLVPLPRQKVLLDTIMLLVLDNKQVVKWMNGTIMEKVCCMISNAKLSKSIWVKAASKAC